MLTWQQRAAALAAGLDVRDPAWRRAFAQVPRHVFVPRFVRDYSSPNEGSLDGSAPDTREEWLDEVYRDQVLVTQVIEPPGSGLAVPTSSSSPPSLMARMLDLLDVRDGDAVLEIGTGTGYNAALLAHRLGDDRVTSMDIDPDLVDGAREALRAAGFAPTLVVGDGAAGVPDRAPFDRILATCAVSRIPPAWLAQLADDGVIVTDVRSATSSALLVARRIGDGTVVGRYHATSGHFMWLRPRVDDPLRHPGEGVFVFDWTGARHAVAQADPAVLDDPGFRFYLGVRMPDLVQALTFTEPRAHVLRVADGSLARVETATRTAVQVGQRCLWEEVEAAARSWIDLGRPVRSRFGVTVAPDGTQWTWLDRPEALVRA